ncbi:MAG: response regulator transcription factor [Oscillospiraceae bacterium]|nr:response regulator transcription factor [Oscillospiraceae bacterium]
MAYILVAEDEQAINDLIYKNLRLVGHTVEQAFDGVQALDMIKQNSYDLVLLDIMMPQLSGLEVKKLIPADLPAIFVTAKVSVSDQLVGLGLGADDYITKPFDILVLLARVENILRRTKKNSTVFTIKDCIVDLNSRTVTKSGAEVVLTLQEFNLLEALILNRNFALSRDKLLQLAWGYDYMGDSRTVDVHIQKLRKKLDLQNEIATVYKYGYRLEV